MTVAAQEFNVGDRRLNFSIGVGTIAGDGDLSTTSFDQHFGMEWGVARIGDKITVGAGFSINNTYGPLGDMTIAGTYNYYYYQHVNSTVIDYNKGNQAHREGIGTAQAKITREDINALATVSFHYSPMPKLDVYANLGVGVGVMNYIVGDPHDEQGFSARSGTSKLPSGTTVYTSYNDLDHVKWMDMETKFVPAISVYVGATYYLNDRWGLEAQVGLLSANIKDKDKGYPNSYSVFSVGASYKF